MPAGPAAREYPNATLITGHLATDDEYCRVVNEHPNVYMGTCLPIHRPDLATTLRKLDGDNLLFGSVAPNVRPAAPQPDRRSS